MLSPVLVPEWLSKPREGETQFAFDRVLLHEMARSALKANVGKNDLRFSVLLQAARNAAKNEAVDYYGLTNVQEFVAEALTNPSFRQFLARPQADADRARASWDSVKAQFRRICLLRQVPAGGAARS